MARYFQTNVYTSWLLLLFCLWSTHSWIEPNRVGLQLSSHWTRTAHAHTHTVTHPEGTPFFFSTKPLSLAFGSANHFISLVHVCMPFAPRIRITYRHLCRLVAVLCVCVFVFMSFARIHTQTHARTACCCTLHTHAVLVQQSVMCVWGSSSISFYFSHSLTRSLTYSHICSRHRRESKMQMSLLLTNRSFSEVKLSDTYTQHTTETHHTKKTRIN